MNNRKNGNFHQVVKKSSPSYKKHILLNVQYHLI